MLEHLNELESEMCRALLAVEQTPRNHTCPWCDNDLRFYAHHLACLLDAALTKAGLPTQEARDRARKEMVSK